ncbi:MAG: prenyltransferase [Desulfomonile tiedjei]|nr:prenyltransferase [Desulfomonile tiedjei]
MLTNYARGHSASRFRFLHSARFVNHLVSAKPIDYAMAVIDNSGNYHTYWGNPMERLGYWLKEIRAPFLSLPVVLVFLGTSVAAADGSFHFGRALLAMVGLTLLHISVNVLNEYSDYHTGIDFHTSPTPFSGGSGMLTSGLIAPSAAYVVGIACLLVNVLIGLFFIWLTNWWLLPLLLVGAFCVFSYTTLLAKHSVGELFAGMGLGLLPIMGSYFVQTGHYSYPAFAAAIPAGILTFNLLLLNEFPDLEADIKGGRRNLLITFGAERAGKIYTVLLALMYVWIAVSVAGGLIPVWGLAAMLTLLVAWKPMKWAWSDIHNKNAMVPAMAANVMTNLATQALLGAGFLASIYL